MCTQPYGDQIKDNIGVDAQKVNLNKDIGQTVIKGDVATGSGDFVGRDKVITHNINTSVINIYNPPSVFSSANQISIKLVLDRTFKEYAPKDQDRLLEAIRHILHADISIGGIEQAM